MAKILLAEDDELLSSALVDALSTEGYGVSAVKTAGDAIAMFEYAAFDLLILDWNLADGTGFDVCKRYRKTGKAEPILFLTSRGDIDDKESAFQSGADDYLTKPFQLRELLSRVKALLRRPVGFVDAAVTIGSAKFDKNAGTITQGERTARLQPREAELLEFFIKRPNQVIRAEHLIAGVWGSEFEGSEVAFRACLAKVRKALAPFGLDKTIVTVHGFGYQFKPDAVGS